MRLHGFTCLAVALIWAALFVWPVYAQQAGGLEGSPDSTATADTADADVPVGPVVVIPDAPAEPITASPDAPDDPVSTCGAPSNPWGFTYCGGTLIVQPPANLCSVFDCIPSFWRQVHGYVIQCSDGLLSHSGGVRGSCSGHGGNRRPLYAPN